MSFEDLLKRANQGDADAQYKVGEHYVIHDDYVESFTYHRLSAKQNHPDALNRIGWYYCCGLNVAQNYIKAFEHYLLSAEQKCLKGYGNVAHCYSTGNGVKKDLKKALEYYYLNTSKYKINECEILILKQFSETLNEDDYLYAYPLYVKHNHKDLGKLKILLCKKYVKAMHFMLPVLSDIIISFLL